MADHGSFFGANGKKEGVCPMEVRSGDTSGDGIFFYFSKAFNTVSQSILLDKMSNTQLNKHVMCWVRNWITGWAQRVTVNGVTSDWGPVTSEALQSFILGPVIFNILIIDLDVQLEGILNKFANDARLGGTVISIKGKGAL